MNGVATLILKKNEERRIGKGHLWIFSNEVDNKATPLKGFSPGQQVIVEDYRHRFMGYASVNPASLICARVLNREQSVFNQELLAQRLNQALQMRQTIYREPYYRWVFAESDLLPGLVIDRYNDICVVQITTAGMEVMIDDIVSAIDSLIKPTTVLLRSDSSARKLEQLPLYVKTIKGDERSQLQIMEGDNRYIAPFSHGQKTGWFYDQRDNRLSMMNRYAAQRSVLDVFSYVGGWGICAAQYGATQVVRVDQSKLATDYIQKNAELNQVADQLIAVQANATDYLSDCIQKRLRFGVIIVDPPAFIKSKKHYKQGLGAYRHVNQMAIELLEDDGILISCSCSYHLSRSELIRQVQLAALKQGKHCQIIQHGYQSSDHPIHAAIPETDYLTVVVFRMTHQ